MMLSKQPRVPGAPFGPFYRLLHQVILRQAGSGQNGDRAAEGEKPTGAQGGVGWWGPRREAMVERQYTSR